MNAESIGVLQVMISQTKPKIQGGGNHPLLVVSVTKKLGSLRVKHTSKFTTVYGCLTL